MQAHQLGVIHFDSSTLGTAGGNIRITRGSAAEAKAVAMRDIADFYANEAIEGFSIDSAVPTRYLDPTIRPPYRAGQVEQVWQAALRAGGGEVRDPHTGELLEWNPSISRNGQWDMGHVYGENYSAKHAQLMRGELTWEEFSDWYHDPLNYQPQSVPSNRSGIHD
jgi:hypothetical protein